MRIASTASDAYFNGWEYRRAIDLSVTHDLAFRPLETALENGVVDAIYTQSKPFQHLQEATGKFKAIEDLSRYPDWTLQVANIPAAITCSDVMAEQHPELVVTFMKGMIKVGRWANEHKHAAAAILDKQTFYLDVEDTYCVLRKTKVVVLRMVFANVSLDD